MQQRSVDTLQQSQQLPAFAPYGPAPDSVDPQRLRALYERSDQGVVIEDERGALLFANSAFARMLGYDCPESLLELGSVTALLVAEDRERWLRYALDRHAGRRAPSHYEARFRHRDGGERVLLNVVSTVHWEGRLAQQGVLIDMTERAHATEALARSERRWRDLIEGSIQGILVHRRQKVLFANTALARILGYGSVDELLALDSGMALVAPHDRRRIAGYGDLRASGGAAPERYSFDGLCKDGRLVRLEVTVRATEWEGEPATQATLVDVTEQHQAQLALIESETRYRELAAAGTDWYWETDPEHRFVQTSDGLDGAIALSRDQVLGRTRFELVDGDSLAPAAQEAHRRDLDARRPFRDLVYRSRLLNRAGHRPWVKVSGTPRFDARGGFLGYRGRASDITAEMQARERARAAEERFVSAIECLSDGYALFGPDQRLVVCNAAYRSMHAPEVAALIEPGVTFERMLEAQLEHDSYPSARGREAEWLAERLEDFRSGTSLNVVQRADGRWQQTRDFRCPDGSTMVICTDISTLKRREQELERSERRLKDYVGASSDWYWETDAELRFTYISKRFTELTGIDYRQFLGRFRADVAPAGADPAEWRKHRQDLQARRPFRNFIYWMQDAGGQKRHFRVNGVPVFAHEDGRFLGYRGTALDFTSDVQAREAQERFLDAIEAVSEGYALFDADDRVVVYNSTWLNLASNTAQRVIRPGMTFEEILRDNLANGAFPNAAADPEAWVQERLRRHRACAEPFEIRRDSGRWFQVRERRTPEGGVLLLVTEITELKQREQALRRSEERFKDFAQTAADWFWELDADLRLTFLSPRYQQITGIACDSLLGQPLAAIVAFGARDSEPVQTMLAALRRGEPIEDAEFYGAIEEGALTGQGNALVVHNISGRPVVDETGHLAGYRGTGRDVTQERLLSMQLAYQASHDELTGLANRREFEQRLQRAIDGAAANRAEHALCYLDLDQFKVVNDTCGHAAGDELLRQLGGTLRLRLRGRDTLARLGGDEFALLLEHCSLDQATQIAESLRAAIDGFEFAWESKRFRLGASVGLVSIAEAGASVSDALRAADSACYMAKERGRNRVHVYQPDDEELRRREGEMHWVARINKALAEDRFELHAQAMVPAACGGQPGPAHRYELLLRMIDERGARIAPGVFLPAAERYGLANRIDRWVLNHALERLGRDRCMLDAGVVFGINLSGQSMADGDFFSFVVDRLQAHGVHAREICFEMTETAAIGNVSGARQFMGMIREQGCCFALDDFGSGLSSFAYLRDLPVDLLKIDGAFIRDVEHDPVSLAMVRSINEIGHVMGKRTVAEYVQSEAAVALLRELGVDYLQGFAVGEPIPLADLLRTYAAR